ncbi:MAG: sigma-70 family RNA polymerase sigma factor [Tannerellaceae bacterium]|nr:sigma-70 family RNA polymerase sigma factor [Tannerellaceae bacterium]
MEEQLLIIGCKRAESWARKKVYELYAPVMLSVCMRYVRDRETARDLLQDGFIKVFTKVGTYTGQGSFEGWIRRIFVTTALEYLRAKDAIKQSVSLEDYPEAGEDQQGNVLDKLSADELLECIGKLPRGYRTVFNLFAIEGYTHQEIADMLGISVVTSRTQFMRARNLLQKSVQSLLEQEDARGK